MVLVITSAGLEGGARVGPRTWPFSEGGVGVLVGVQSRLVPSGGPLGDVWSGFHLEGLLEMYGRGSGLQVR